MRFFPLSLLLLVVACGGSTLKEGYYIEKQAGSLYPVVVVREKDGQRQVYFTSRMTGRALAQSAVGSGGPLALEALRADSFVSESEITPNGTDITVRVRRRTGGGVNGASRAETRLAREEYLEPATKEQALRLLRSLPRASLSRERMTENDCQAAFEMPCNEVFEDPAAPPAFSHGA